MRAFKLFLLLAFSAMAAPASAQDQVALCASSDTAFDERVAACNTLVGNEGFQDQAWAQEQLGDAYKDERLFDEAVTYYNLSIEIEPRRETALAGRAYCLDVLKQFDAALADATLAGEVDPADFYNPYLRGKILANLDRADESIAAFSQSIALKDDFRWSFLRRGYLYAAQGMNEEAARDILRVTELRPFMADAYSKLGSIYANAGNQVNAARYYRIAEALNPNLSKPPKMLANLVTPQENPTLAPLAFSAPQDGLALQYLQVLMPLDARDDMEAAIGALADWFRPVPKAQPSATAFITRTLQPHGDFLDIGLQLDAQNGMGNAAQTMPAQVSTIRGLLTSEIQTVGNNGENGPIIQVSYEGQDPTTLWPLAVGNEVIGTGRYVLDCPKSPVLAAVMMGCRSGIAYVNMGRFEYSLTVEKVEDVHVPMGQYMTYVVRYRERGTASFMGSTRARDLETKWWISPELGFWVKRTNIQGDKIAILQAMDIVAQ